VHTRSSMSNGSLPSPHGDVATDEMSAGEERGRRQMGYCIEILVHFYGLAGRPLLSSTSPLIYLVFLRRLRLFDSPLVIDGYAVR
jgi:hypothetical protein